jgi:translation initiation factor 1
MSNKNKNKNGIVYSTNPDFETNNGGNDPAFTLKPSEQILRVWRDSKSRGGKTATIVKGFIGSDIDLSQLGKTLKSKLGVGGTTKEGEIIIQGDFKDKITKLLQEMGYQAKSAGG